MCVTVGQSDKLINERQKNEAFLHTRLVPGSFHSYVGRWNKWVAYTKSRRLNRFLKGVDVTTQVMYLTTFIRSCREEGESPRNCIDKLTAISFFWKGRGYDAAVFGDGRITMLKRALTSGTTSKEGVGSRQKRVRLPFSFDMIQEMRGRLWNQGGVDERMTYMFAVLAFHFMLRHSNLIVTTAQHYLLGEDIEFLAEEGGKFTRWSYTDLRKPGVCEKITRATLAVRSSKTSKKPLYLQLGRCTMAESQLLDDLITWGRTSRSLPGEPLLSRREGSGHGSYKALTAKMATMALKHSATLFQLEARFFTLHSLRIGGATANKSAGVPRNDYKAVANWSEKSDNDELYTSTVRGHGTLAHVGRPGMTTARDIALLIPPPARLLAAAVVVRQKRGNQPTNRRFGGGAR